MFSPLRSVTGETSTRNSSSITPITMENTNNFCYKCHARRRKSYTLASTTSQHLTLSVESDDKDKSMMHTCWAELRPNSYSAALVVVKLCLSEGVGQLVSEQKILLNTKFIAT